MNEIVRECYVFEEVPGSFLSRCNLMLLYHIFDGGSKTKERKHKENKIRIYNAIIGVSVNSW